MKLFNAAFFTIVSLGLLSGCAYLQGRKDDQAQTPPAKKGTVIQAPRSTQPSQNTGQNPSQTASKMIAPITQFAH